MYDGVHFSATPDLSNVARIDHSCLPMIAAMHRYGIRIDRAFLRTLGNKIESNQAQLHSDITQSIGISYQDFNGKSYVPFNPSSPDHVARLLFHHLRVQGDTPVPMTKKGKRESTDDETLGMYESKHAVVDLILSNRELDKLLGTYVYPILAKTERDDYLHTEFSATTAATGRLSSKNPNCFTGDTEVLTPGGWVRFDKYTHGLVAQWEDGKISFEEPILRTAHVAPQVIRLYNEHTDIACTPDHRCLLVSRRGEKKVFPALDYKSDYKQLHAGTYVPLSRGLDISDVEIQMLVAMQADASRMESGWDVSFKKPRKIKRFEELLKKCQLYYRIQMRKSGQTRFYVQDRGSRMRTLLGVEKVFGEWIMQMSLHQLGVFFDELWHWDGCFTRQNHYASKVRSNADWVQIVAILTGRTANVRRYVSNGGSVSWQVDVTRRDYTFTTNTQREDLPSQRVYCVSVPSTFLVVRRNNKVSITGNCQNIPTRTKLGREIRNAFVASPGCLLVSTDLSQIEMRWAAHRSQDPTMLSVFQKGEDIHSRTTCNVFGLDYAHIDALTRKVEAKQATVQEQAEYKHFKQFQRLPCKTVGFGVLYGQTAQGLQSSLATEGVVWTQEECQDLIENKFFGVYPRLRDMLERDHYTARRYAMIWDDFGRVRLVPEAKSCHKRISEEGVRKAGNHPEQAGAQGTEKLGMAELHPLMESINEDYTCRPVLQIHDDCLADVSSRIAGEYAEIARGVFEGASPLNGVPVLSSVSIGERWGEL